MRHDSAQALPRRCCARKSSGMIPLRRSQASVAAFPWALVSALAVGICAVAPPPVAPPSAPALETSSDQFLSLHDAIGTMLPGAQKVVNLTSNSRYVVDGSPVVISNASLALQSDGTATIDGQGSSGLFIISGRGAVLGVHGVVLFNGSRMEASPLVVTNDGQTLARSVGQGGAIEARDGAYVLLRSVHVSNCVARRGGGVMLDNAGLVCENCLFTDCVAQLEGGAIGTSNGELLGLGIDGTEESLSLVIIESTLANCSAKSGGGLMMEEGTLIASHCSFNNCQSFVEGGAVCELKRVQDLRSGLGKLRKSSFLYCTFTDCTSTTGAALYTVGCDLELVLCSVSRAVSAAGAIAARSSNVNVLLSQVTGCVADSTLLPSLLETMGSGGAFYFEGVSALLFGVTVSDCNAIFSGGGLWATHSAVSVEFTEFQHDHVLRTLDDTAGGGAMSMVEASSLAMRDSRIYDCSAPFGGGCFFTTLATPESNYTERSTSSSIAAFFYGRVQIEHCRFEACVADLGGAHYVGRFTSLTIFISEFRDCVSRIGGIAEASFFLHQSSFVQGVLVHVAYACDSLSKINASNVAPGANSVFTIRGISITLEECPSYVPAKSLVKTYPKCAEGTFTSPESQTEIPLCGPGATCYDVDVVSDPGQCAGLTAAACNAKFANASTAPLCRCEPPRFPNPLIGNDDLAPYTQLFYGGGCLQTQTVTGIQYVSSDLEVILHKTADAVVDRYEQVEIQLTGGSPAAPNSTGGYTVRVSETLSPEWLKVLKTGGPITREDTGIVVPLLLSPKGLRNGWQGFTRLLFEFTLGKIVVQRLNVSVSASVRADPSPTLSGFVPSVSGTLGTTTDAIIVIHDVENMTIGDVADEIAISASGNMFEYEKMGASVEFDKVSLFEGAQYVVPLPKLPLMIAAYRVEATFGGQPMRGTSFDTLCLPASHDPAFNVWILLGGLPGWISLLVLLWYIWTHRKRKPKPTVLRFVKRGRRSVEGEELVLQDTLSRPAVHASARRLRGAAACTCAVGLFSAPWMPTLLAWYSCAPLLLSSIRTRPLRDAWVVSGLQRCRRQLNLNIALSVAFSAWEALPIFSYTNAYVNCDRPGMSTLTAVVFLLWSLTDTCISRGETTTFVHSFRYIQTVVLTQAVATLWLCLCMSVVNILINECLEAYLRPAGDVGEGNESKKPEKLAAATASEVKTQPDEAKTGSDQSEQSVRPDAASPLPTHPAYAAALTNDAALEPAPQRAGAALDASAAGAGGAIRIPPSANADVPPGLIAPPVTSLSAEALKVPQIAPQSTASTVRIQIPPRKADVFAPSTLPPKLPHVPPPRPPGSYPACSRTGVPAIPKHAARSGGVSPSQKLPPLPQALNHRAAPSLSAKPRREARLSDQAADDAAAQIEATSPLLRQSPSPSPTSQASQLPQATGQPTPPLPPPPPAAQAQAAAAPATPSVLTPAAVKATAAPPQPAPSSESEGSAVVESKASRWLTWCRSALIRSIIVLAVSSVWVIPVFVFVLEKLGSTSSSSCVLDSLDFEGKRVAAFGLSALTALGVLGLLVVAVGAARSISVDVNLGNVLKPALGGGRFVVASNSLISGQPSSAATGIFHFMAVDEATTLGAMRNGVAAIEEEFEQHGTEDDKECLRYVLYGRAGESDRVFQHGWRRDEGRNGEVLQDFVDHPCSRAAGLSPAHVLAARLYTTIAFLSINRQLRDLKRDEAGKVLDPPQLRQPHKMPATVAFLSDALKRLRAANTELQRASYVRSKRGRGRASRKVGVAPKSNEDQNGPPNQPGIDDDGDEEDEDDEDDDDDESTTSAGRATLYRIVKAKLLSAGRWCRRYFLSKCISPSRLESLLDTWYVEKGVLWRGMRDIDAAEWIKSGGGTELATMSTTGDIRVALKYTLGSKTSSLLFMLKIPSFMQQGADLSYLSAFPQERECTYPPLTFIKPTGRERKIVDGELNYHVVEVLPYFPS